MPFELGVQNTSKSGLETCIVIDGDFVTLEIGSIVLVLVVGIWATSQGAVQNLRIRVLAVVVVVVTNCWSIRTGSAKRERERERNISE